jgi:hypothetical protein
MTNSDKQRLDRIEEALYVLAREQSNQSGAKPKLVKVLRRYAPDQPETRPADAFERRVVA